MSRTENCIIGGVILAFMILFGGLLLDLHIKRNDTIQADTEIRELAQHNRDLQRELEDQHNVIPECPHCGAMLFKDDAGAWEAWFRVDAGDLSKLGEVEE